MKDLRRARLYVAAVAALVLASAAWPQSAWAGRTVRIAGPKALNFDARTKVLKVDLSGLPKDARVFRAELMLSAPGRGRRPMEPTTVFPVGQPDTKLKLVGPRFVSLDALALVRAALEAGGQIGLTLQTTAGRVNCLEVSYLGGAAGEAEIPAVTDLKVTHRKGQSLIVFAEPKLNMLAAVQAPFDGDLKSVATQKGQEVKQGDVLAQLDTTEWEKQLATAKAEEAKHAGEEKRLRDAGKRAEANAARNNARQAARTVASLTDKIARAAIRSPIDGTVVSVVSEQSVGKKIRARTKVAEVAGVLAAGAYPKLANGGEAARLRAAVLSKSANVRYRIWRSSEPITPETISKASMVGECGPMTCWNSGYHQGATGRSAPLRYRVTDNGDPVPWGTGIYAHNPAKAGKAYYAVSVAVDGEEDFTTLGKGNTTAEGVDEVVGMGEPILQWVEQPKNWHYRNGPLTRLIYTRWESWPHASTPSKPIDYLVAMGDKPLPDKPGREAPRTAWRVDPAPVGLHLHCWGGSLNGGYGWWHNAHRGAVLISSNQIPYDWWTGYHEANGTCKTYGDGYVRPFSMDRTFGFLDWAATQWKDGPEGVRKHWRKLDMTRVFTAGSSMGGSGAPMFAVRHGGRIAWALGWVGVHVPAESPTFTGSYRGSYGARHEAITMPDEKTSPWDHFSDVWWLRNNIKAETGFILASNGKDDGGIGWPQAAKFARALQETRRPHMFNWGLGGHGVRTIIGANFNLDVRTDQTLPAFTNGTLDQDVGTGKMMTKEQRAAERSRLQAEARKAGKDPSKVRVGPADGDTSGAYNRHLWWETKDVVDTPEAWEMTVILQASAPADKCSVDLTPRRLQKFATPKGRKFDYTVTELKGGEVLTKGTAEADEYDLLTLKQIPLRKGNNRVKITPAK